MKLVLGALLSFLGAGLTPAQALSAAWGKKPYGVLLAGSGGGVEWNSLVGQLRKGLGKQRPLETVTGSYGTREVQHAIDRLQAQRVSKIVVVPLYLYPHGADVEQLRYLLGIRELPSEEFLEGWGMKSRVVKRAKAKVPIVMADELAEEGFIAEIFLQHAQKLSLKPKKEVVVLIGQGRAADDENTAREELLTSISGKMLVRSRFRSVQAALLRPPTKEKPKQAEESERAMRKLIRDNSVRSRVIVVPYLMARDGSGRALRKKLNNQFYRWSGGALLPDRRVAAWVLKSAKRAAQRTDMVKFKDAGKGLPKKNPWKTRSGKRLKFRVQ